MSEMDGFAPAGDDVGLAQLLAEAAADLDGAGDRLAAGLRADLEALLKARIAASDDVSLQEVGQLARLHWHRLAHSEREDEEPVATPRTLGTRDPEVDDNVCDEITDGVTDDVVDEIGSDGPTRTNSRQRPSAGVPRYHDAARARSAAAPRRLRLFNCHAAQSTVVLRRLVQEFVTSSDPEGPASRSLHALDALGRLEPRVAMAASLCWFGGLDDMAIARVMGQDALEVGRLRVKALAFVGAAASAAARSAAPGPATE